MVRPIYPATPFVSGHERRLSLLSRTCASIDAIRIPATPDRAISHRAQHNLGALFAAL